MYYWQQLMPNTCSCIQMLAATEECPMVWFPTDAAYTKHWKLALQVSLQYLYLVRHSQFPVSLLQMMHLPRDITL